MKADEFQQSAITHGTGPALVSAGPGSGKTFVLIRRIQYLIQILGVPPKEILVLTFSKAAAIEMKTRFLNLQSEMPDTDISGVFFGTFHALFYRILRIYDTNHKFEIISENEKIKMMKEILKSTGCKLTNSEFASELLSDLQSHKSKDNPLSKYSSRHIEEKEFQRIVTLYEQTKKERGYLDFDDILYAARDYLVANPGVLASVQKRFSFLLIDEFQDINPIQYEVISMIADAKKNIFAVGDDDQSIYAFRGANPKIMKEFLLDYPGAKHIALSNNYRCGKQIVNSSGRLIMHNKNRIEKEIVSVKGIEGRVECDVFQNETEEYEALASSVASYTPAEIADSAVIVRTNEVRLSMIRAFKKQGIPFFFSEKPMNLYEHAISRDLFAYLHLSANVDGELDKEELMRVCNKPNRYFSYDLLDGDTISFAKLIYRAASKPYLKKNLIQFRNDLRKISEMSPYPALLYILKSVGYEQYSEMQYSIGGKVSGERLKNSEIIRELMCASKEYDSLEEWERDIRLFAGETGTGNDRRMTKEVPDGNGIKIITMHSSKGLEFDHVWIPDLYEGNMPIKQAVTEEEIEEERRLLYVAMTRAKNTLHIYGAGKKSNVFVKSSREDLSHPTRRAGCVLRKQEKSLRNPVHKKTEQLSLSRFFHEIIN